MKLLFLLPLLLGLMTPAIAHNAANTPGYEPPSAGNTENASGTVRADDEKQAEKPDFDKDLDF